MGPPSSPAGSTVGASRHELRRRPVKREHRRFQSVYPKSRIGRALERGPQRVTHWTGSSWAFALAALVIATWLLTGPLFHFSDTWQLVINTGTTIVTFLMVFLIQ